MPSFDLVKTSSGDIRGRTQTDDQAFKRHKGWVKGLGAGEFYTVTIKRVRDPVKHKKYWSLIRFLFDHWDPEQTKKQLKYKGKPVEKNIDSFRRDLTILAGYGVPTYEVGPKGGVRVRMDAKSIAHDAMDDDEFNALYKALIGVAIKHFLPTSYHTPDHVREVIEKIESYDS